MEEKNLKIPVYNMDTLVNNSAEIPIDVDFTMPDYFPEISKILKCRAVSRIASKICSGNSITVDGCVTVTVIYSSPEHRICAYEYQYPFNKTFDAGCDTNGTCLIAKCKTEYINCRAVTGRKIDVHGAVGVYLNLSKRKCTDIIADVDIPSVELLRGKARATSPMGIAEKYLILEEDIELSDGKPSINSVLRYDASATVKECKLINNKAMVKGELSLRILYLPESGEPEIVTDTEPFSQLVEIDGVNDQCECSAMVQLANIELKPRVSASGEARSFILNCKMLVCCECCCNNDIEIVRDAYSRKFEADIKRSKVKFNKLEQKINENFNCKKGLKVPDLDIASVCDMWCEVGSVKAVCKNGEIKIDGTVTASFILKNAEGEPFFYEKSIEFEYSKPIDIPAEKFYCEPQVTVITCGYTLTGGSGIELYVELCVNASVYRSESVSLITDLCVNENTLIAKKDMGAMTVYFASEGENIWDIARKYLASVDEIKAINDIDSDVLGLEKMILVPMN